MRDPRVKVINLNTINTQCIAPNTSIITSIWNRSTSKTPTVWSDLRTPARPTWSNSRARSAKTKRPIQPREPLTTPNINIIAIKRMEQTLADKGTTPPSTHWRTSRPTRWRGLRSHPSTGAGRISKKATRIKAASSSWCWRIQWQAPKWSCLQFQTPWRKHILLIARGRPGRNRR